MRAKPKQSSDIQLYEHEGQNPFSGSYTNAVCARRSGNRTFTVWVKAWSADSFLEDCWNKEIESPKDFISACQACLEFVEFGDADVVDVIRGGFAGIKRLHEEFAAALRAELLAEFSEDCAAALREVEKRDAGRSKVRRLTNVEAREKYGSSIMFISNARPASSEEEAAHLEVGEKQGNRTLVAKGDDFPDEWDGWLDEIVESYSTIVKEALRRELDLDSLGLVEGPEGLKKFAEQLGVEFEQEFWEGECISGLYQRGWIETSKIRRAAADGRKLLEKLQKATRA
jgi:hypothetical protein